MTHPLENLSVPNPPVRPDENLKLALLDTRRSSAVGLALVAVPVVCVLTMLAKHELGIDLAVIDWLERFFVTMDRHPATHWLTPLLMAVLPLIAVALNVLAILHVAYSREARLLTLTVKLRALNVIIVLIGSAVLGVLFLYQIGETFVGRG